MEYGSFKGLLCLEFATNSRILIIVIREFVANTLSEALRNKI